MFRNGYYHIGSKTPEKFFVFSLDFIIPIYKINSAFCQVWKDKSMEDSEKGITVQSLLNQKFRFGKFIFLFSVLEFLYGLDRSSFFNFLACRNNASLS